MSIAPVNEKPTGDGNPKTLLALPISIWTLGFVSFFMDVSSELIHSLLPVFLSATLGASMLTIGFIEGVAEATASFMKVSSGAISDYLGKRKFLAALGYGMAALTKPIFPLAQTIAWVAAARFIDRIGKGIRGAPRDALIADLVTKEQRGAAFGLRQSLDSLGAFIGPILAVAFLLWFALDIRTVLWIAVLPAFIAFGLLVFGIQEPDRPASETSKRPSLSFASARLLPREYWAVVILGIAFTLARFSEAFLVLRGQKLGLSIGYVPLVFIVMNVVFFLSAYPAGLASDRMSRRRLLVLGLLVLIAADVVLANASAITGVFVGAGLWGLHLGLTQGLFSKMVADTAPESLRGTSFGIFNLAVGVALLLGNALAGLLWHYYGAATTFYAGAGFSALAILRLLFGEPTPRSAPNSSQDHHPGQ